jgi:Domain of unknown function (DUF4333)
MNTGTRWAVGVALIPAAFVIGGCARTVDTDQLQKQIETNIKTQVKQGVKVKCPSDITAEKGKKVLCQVKLANGIRVTLQATLVDDNGRFTFVILARKPGVTTAPAPAPVVTAPPPTTTPAPAATTPAPAATTPAPATTTPTTKP